LYNTRNRLTELSIEDPEIELLYNKVLSIKEQRDD
ncbi:MAG: gamma-glutamylcyclotransferase, partial [Flavobacteriia bacterium]|nr:gamma-glutamylcyclotransferase [Flavobacteriia bacterium]